MNWNGTRAIHGVGKVPRLGVQRSNVTSSSEEVSFCHVGWRGFEGFE